MEGVINLRGKIVSVIDLRKRLGEKVVAASARSRILVVEHKGRLCGLIVDSASEVLKIPVSDIEPPPTVFQDGALQCVTGMGKFQGRLIVLLDTNKLLSQEALLGRTDAPEAQGAAAGK